MSPKSEMLRFVERIRSCTCLQLVSNTILLYPLSMVQLMAANKARASASAMDNAPVCTKVLVARKFMFASLITISSHFLSSAIIAPQLMGFAS
ncbi:hypothetical protein D0Y65_051595 [Glycine soja]|uniref:Uncharacterized protein n=2 Tax=Glycine subgen. Soja TaxID=1462606 RepID=A0A0R0EN15_SOYBN|nr:hypothetical protein D0Y65_051595 [Glycine soja]